MNKKIIVFIKTLLLFVALSFLFLPIIYTTLSTLPNPDPSSYSWMSVTYISIHAYNKTIFSYILIALNFGLPLIMMSLIIARLIYGERIKISYIIVLSLCLIYFIFLAATGNSLLFLIPVIIFAGDIVYEILLVNFKKSNSHNQ